jgi:hypothetical protein
MTRAPRPLARHALALWLFGIATLGLLRSWLKLREAGAAALPLDGWLWFGCSCACAIVGLAVLVRGRR